MADIKPIPVPATGQPAAQPAAAQKTAEAAGMAGFGAMKEKIAGFIKAGPQQWDIGLVNLGLMAVIGILIIIFVIRSLNAWNELKKESVKEYVISSASKAEAGFKEIASMKGVAYYIGKLSGRDIFSRKAKQDDLTNEPVFSTKMADMTANLKLVGISMSDNPDAMIEDTRLQKTFFVKMGSMVGDLRVDLITKDKVVLKYNKELFELK
jgi:hypothetical protein